MAFVEVKIEYFIWREREGKEISCTSPINTIAVTDKELKRGDARISNCSLVPLLLRSARIFCFSMKPDNNSEMIRKHTHSLTRYLFWIFFYFETPRLKYCFLCGTLSHPTTSRANRKVWSTYTMWPVGKAVTNIPWEYQKAINKLWLKKCLSLFQLE